MPGSDPRLDGVVRALRAAGCVFAEAEADQLLEDRPSDPDLAARVRRRAGGEPLEYVVGYADFAGVRVALDPGVFIPRQRSRALVQVAAALAPPAAVVVDLCCGSGALGLALHRVLGSGELHAADVDETAVRCAARNLAPVGGVVHRGDLTAALPDGLRGRVDVLLANVPYVPTGELHLMPGEARDHEPRRTHDGGPDGLDVLRRVAVEAGVWLGPEGHVLFEIHAGQAAAARAALTGAGLTGWVEERDEVTVLVGGRPVPT